MVQCETCGEDADTLWERYARHESMTHRRVRTVCAACHPHISESVEAEDAAVVALADGGRSP